MMDDKKSNIAIPNGDEVEQYAPSGDADGAGRTEGPGRDSVESLRAERDELKEKLLRAQAEAANISKRLHQHHGEALKHAANDVVRGLLPVLDNLERSVEGLKAARVDAPLTQGIQLIADQFLKALRDQGVEPIATKGTHFDPNLHEALSSDPTSREPAGTVIEVFQPGYVMNGRVVRPAKVVISARPDEQER